jgi:hypothetical protein
MHYNASVAEAFNSVEHEPYLLFSLSCAYLSLKVNIFNNLHKTLLSSRSIIPLQNVAQFCSLAKGINNAKSKKYDYNNVDTLNSISDESFLEWFRGLTDGEGCFEIIHQNSKFYFRFSIYMHKDDTPMLNIVCKRLKIGKVIERDHFTTYSVTSEDILKIIEIFDKYPLNTSKYLNYLAFKEGYQIYNNDNKKDLVLKNILALKDSMNKKRVFFELPSNHSIKITPY